MNFLADFGFLAALAPFILFFKQIKAFLYKVVSFFIRTDTIQGMHVRYFLNHLLKNSKIIKFGNEKYTSYFDYSKLHKKQIDFSFGYRDSLTLLYKNKIPIFISAKSESINITYLYKSFNIKNIFKESLQDYYNNLKQKDLNTKRFFYCHWRGDECPQPSLSSESNLKSSNAVGISDQEVSLLSQYHVIPEFLNYVDLDHTQLGYSDKVINKKSYFWSIEALSFKKELSYWKNNESWFIDREIPWRRGVLLHGIPGSGKSKMVYQSCVELDIPLYYFDISRMSNEEFQDKVKNVQFGSVILIEDIDTVFHGRENILNKNNQHKQYLTFDCLINSISGAKENSGKFFVVTTNKKELLDKALLRAGRLDKKIEVNYISIEGKRYIAKNILIDWPEDIIDMVDNTGKMPIVEFENLCIEKAQEKFWDKIEKST